jgi:mRNA interferase RelE/StbE
MAYRVALTELAQQDFDELDGSLKKQVADCLRKKLMVSPDYGEPLGNKYGINLSGLHRLRFNDRRHRIIYKLEEDDARQITIIAIGPRKDELIYKIAESRLHLKP